MKTKKSISDDIHKAVALCAYHIWEREGRPDGCEALHWRMAEAEILGEPPAEKAAVPATAPAKKPAKKATAAKAAPQKLDAKKPVAAKAVIAAATSKKAVKAKPAKPAPR